MTGSDRIITTRVHAGPIARASVTDILLNPWIYRILRYGLSLVFLWSGISKLQDPESFGMIIDAFGLVPDLFNLPLALLLLGLEIVAGVGLLLDVRGSLEITSGLLVVFIAVLGYGVWMGLGVDCGCFGPGDLEGEAYHGLTSALYRDLAMLCSILYLYVWRSYRSPHPVGIHRFIKKLRKGG